MSHNIVDFVLQLSQQKSFNILLKTREFIEEIFQFANSLYSSTKALKVFLYGILSKVFRLALIGNIACTWEKVHTSSSIDK